jgi:hypothetical protein
MQLVSTVDISPADLIVRHELNVPHVRSGGLHLSDIYKSICVEMDRKRFDPDKPMDLIRVETGSAFEQILELGLSARHPGLLRPGEVECDGIIGSPDGIDITPSPWRLTEYKATWMSSRGGIGTIENGLFTPHRKFWHWFVQMKGYLYMLNQAYPGLGMVEAQLIVFFVNGDYSKGMGGTGPQLLSWIFEIPPDDQLRNWAMLLQHAIRKGMLCG